MDIIYPKYIKQSMEIKPQLKYELEPNWYWIVVADTIVVMRVKKRSPIFKPKNVLLILWL